MDETTTASTTPEGQGATGTSETAAETTTENGKGIDPSKLAPELQTLYKGFQQDYTAKATALAEARRHLTAIERGLDTAPLARPAVGELRAPLGYLVRRDL